MNENNRAAASETSDAKKPAIADVIMVGAIPLDVTDEKYQFEFSINDPGMVVSAAWLAKPKLIAMRGAAEFDEQLVMFVHVTKTGPQRRRRFAVIPCDRELAVHDGYRAEFVATAVSARGRVAHIFEIRAVS